MEIFFISLIAFAAAILTFFSGFGLGTLLTPVFLIYLPVETAVAFTAIVHFGNNIFKLYLTGSQINKSILLYFGLPAVLAAILGSWILISIPDSQALYSYTLFDKNFFIYPLKLMISFLLIIFALMDLLPAVKKLQFSSDKLIWGGLISGFFGGLSGNQGALRSAFLIKTRMPKETFVATTVAISSLVDVSRLSVYASQFNAMTTNLDWSWLLFPSLSAMLGAFIGNKLLKKILLEQIQTIVAIMVLLLALGIGLGWV
ncbi:MAG: sulfite exporter TauE/SafE family protein [Saprospiraceae bacterium]|nr:sulfite exporter TauE/SafE family protein [Saprospiraceae bacterium]